MGASDAMAKLAQGATLQPESYSLVTVAKFYVATTAIRG